MSAEQGPTVIDYGRPDRMRRRRFWLVLAITLALLIGGFVTTRQVRIFLARRAVERERARLEQIFAGHQRTLAELEARKSDEEARRTASTRAATRPGAADRSE